MSKKVAKAKVIKRRKRKSRAWSAERRAKFNAKKVHQLHPQPHNEVVRENDLGLLQSRYEQAHSAAEDAARALTEAQETRDVCFKVEAECEQALKDAVGRVLYLPAYRSP